MNAIRSLSLLAAALVSSTAFAGMAPTPIPEPGTWALIALAGAIGVVVARNKRK